MEPLVRRQQNTRACWLQQSLLQPADA